MKSSGLETGSDVRSSDMEIMGSPRYERWISHYSSIRADFGGLSQRKSIGDLKISLL